MRILIVEDDFMSRRILTKLLAPYGVCDVAVNGREAIQAFAAALAEGAPYALVCLDIMMPEVDGQEVLKIIRGRESQAGIAMRDEVKILMTSALDKPRDVFEAYTSGCTSYLAKPIDQARLGKHLLELGIFKA
jgi:two-component system chemotaxis response regulator CheY